MLVWGNTLESDYQLGDLGWAWDGLVTAGVAQRFLKMARPAHL